MVIFVSKDFDGSVFISWIFFRIMLRKIWVIETFLNWTTEKMKENIKALVSGLLKENAFSQAHFPLRLTGRR